VQDWIVTRRLFTVPGVVAVNSWGGTTKQYDVDVDLHKLDAYNVTIPQIITALGNANINVGGREITVGQQSVNIRGIGLLDSGGDADLTQGLARQRHRERRARAGERRSDTGQGCRQGFGRLRAAARHRRQGPRQRRRVGDRRYGPRPITPTTSFRASRPRSTR
jgi:multidrug efflux pump subunit AcrB